MTLLKIYKGLCNGTIEFEWGLCEVLDRYGYDWIEFQDITCRTTCRSYLITYYEGFSEFISTPGKWTKERETFLLLFAAYKGEL